jgi:hypothetical protein
MTTHGRSIAILFSALPGIVMLIASGVLFRGEYYQPTFLAAGTVFLAVGMLAAFLLLRLGWFQQTRFRSGLGVFVAILTGWLGALALIGMLNLTPLCVGANNGDGHNNLGMCVFYTVLWAAVYTPPVLIGAILCAILAIALITNHSILRRSY